MKQAEKMIFAEVKKMLVEAEAVDATEDARCGRISGALSYPEARSGALA